MTTKIENQIKETTRVLTEHGILNRNNDTYGAIEVRSYGNDILAASEGERTFSSSHELTYTTSNTRLIASFNDAGELTSVEASAHITNTTEGVDYTQLNADLAAAVK